VRPVPRLYNAEQLHLRDSLETEVRSVGVSRELPASKDVNTEDEEAKAFEAATRRRPAKVVETEKT
jgi:hypothetical protein